AAAPVAAALVFTEVEFLVRTPMPIVFMNDDTRFVGKVIRVMRMPASVALAYDGRGCTESGRHDHHCADCGCGKDSSEHAYLSHGPFARRAKHFGRAFGSEAERKFSRGLGQTTTDAGVAQVSTRPADASMTKEALHRSGIIVWRPRPNGKRSVVSTAGIR